MKSIFLRIYGGMLLALLLVTNLSDRSGEDVETSPRKKRRQKKHSPS